MCRRVQGTASWLTGLDFGRLAEFDPVMYKIDAGTRKCLVEEMTRSPLVSRTPRAHLTELQRQL